MAGMENAARQYEISAGNTYCGSSTKGVSL